MPNKQIEPDLEDEAEDEFMARCTDQGLDVATCQAIWDDATGDTDDPDQMLSAKNIVRKTHLSPGTGLQYVMSDETVDSMDDVISSDGWDLEDFRKNPIALFGHDSNFVIGQWHDVHVRDKQLRGTLKLAKKGTSARVNEVISLVEQGILRAVSVGFSPKEYEPRAKDSRGLMFTKQKLRETSLVAVPANPNALVVAKSLRVSPATLDLVFAGQGKDDGIIRRTRITGGQADSRTRTNGKGTTMSLAQRVIETQKRLLEQKDALAAIHADVGDGDYTDTVLTKITDANADISRAETVLAALRESERNIAIASDDGGRAMQARSKGAGAVAEPPRPFSMPARKISPIDAFINAGIAQILAHRERKPLDEVCRAHFDEATRAVVDWQTRAASAYAMTTVTGWAAELMQQIVVDFMQILMPQSVFPRLSAAGLTLSFGRNGKIIIPTRSRTPTIAGSFVGEGLPIPVRQGAFTSQSLLPKKMAVITTWTREMDEHSIPAIQGLLRDAIQFDTAVALDSILLDNNAATAIRPAGILNGVSGLTPTAGGGFAALTGDIKQLSGALLTGTLGNVRNPRWLMNPQQVNSAGLAIATGAGVFPFRDEISQGRLGGWPIIESGTVPAGTVVAIDAADFVSVTGDGPRFEISDQATLHMEDTAPTDISTSGAAVAFPAKSLFQTDSLALRLVLPMNWTIRRAGTVAWLAGVTW